MAIIKLSALLLVAVCVGGHPVDKDGKWIEQRPATDKWPVRKPGLGTGGGVGGYHGVYGNTRGQSTGRELDVQVQQKDFDDIPRTPVDGFVSQDREGHSDGGPGGEVQLKPQITPIGPASDSFKPVIEDVSDFGGSKDQVPAYHDDKAKESPNYRPGSYGNNPTGSQGPGSGNIKPAYYDEKDKKDLIPENPNKNTNREFIPDHPLSQDKDEIPSVHDDKHHEHKPKVEIEKPFTPDRKDEPKGQFKPIEQGKDSSVPDRPGHSGQVIYPVDPETPIDKYPFDRPSPTDDDKFPQNPDPKYPHNTDGPVRPDQKYPHNPDVPARPDQKYPHNPDDKRPLGSVGPVETGDKYPKHPEGPVRGDDQRPINPVRPVPSDDKHTTNPTGPVHSGEKYPNRPVRPIPTGDQIKPVRPDHPTNTESGHHDVQVQSKDFIPEGQDSKYDGPKDDEISIGHEDVPEKVLPVPNGEPIVPDEPTIPGGQLDSEKPFGPTGEAIDYRPLVPEKPQQPLGPKPTDRITPTGGQDQFPLMRDLCQSLDLKRFLELINRADMSDIFSSKGQITIFAPSDQAFSRLPVHVYYRLTRDKAFLKKVLQYHIIEGVHPIKGDELEGQQLEGGVGFYQTQEPKMRVFFNRYGPNYYVNGLPITKPSQKASNGMIHVIDNVLYPVPSKNMAETLQGISTFTRFHALAKEAGLFDDVLVQGLHTVYAPSDAAFAKLPRRTLEWLTFDKEALKTLLLKHIVPGAHFSSWVPDSGITYSTVNPDIKLDIKHDKDHYSVNGVRIGNHDIVSQDGVLHSINEVLFSKDLQPKVDYRRPGLKRIYPSAPTSS